MRTALLAGLLAAGVVALLNFGRALSNADFIYMCCGAELLKSGRLLASPYFPPGYPVLLWTLMRCGLSALNAGVLLSAFGTGLSAASVAYMARLWRLPAAPALGLGLLAASLPDVFEIAFNPHLDALYTGLGLVFIAAALRALVAKPNAGVSVAMLLSAGAILTLRWHAILLVIPILIVLLCFPRSRPVAWSVLLVTLLALGWSYWALYVSCGSLRSAAPTQVAIGAVYRELGPARAVEQIYNDYAAWLNHAPPLTLAAVIDGIKANYVSFITRKSILIGAGAWLLVLLIFQRAAAQSWWLWLLIAGYVLAISPTYFTPRASALPELCGMLLLAAALAASADWGGPEKRRGAQPAGGRIDPAVAGMVIFALCLLGIGYNVWREVGVAAQWRERGAVLAAANALALDAAAGKRMALYGPLDLTAWPATAPSNLPGATASRMWLDDPTLSPLIDKLIPRYTDDKVLRGETPVRAILLWPDLSERDAKLANTLRESWIWREQFVDISGARLWVRGA